MALKRQSGYECIQKGKCQKNVNEKCERRAEKIPRFRIVCTYV